MCFLGEKCGLRCRKIDIKSDSRGICLSLVRVTLKVGVLTLGAVAGDVREVLDRIFMPDGVSSGIAFRNCRIRAETDDFLDERRIVTCVAEVVFGAVGGLRVTL